MKTDLNSSLEGNRLLSLTRREYDWVFWFEREVSLVVGCLWRLIEKGRVRVTSEDHGHQFGLPAPVDAPAEVNRRLGHSVVKSVALRGGTLDLELVFGDGCALQLIPNSAGYESWQMDIGSGQSLTAMGGELREWVQPPAQPE